MIWLTKLSSVGTYLALISITWEFVFLAWNLLTGLKLRSLITIKITIKWLPTSCDMYKWFQQSEKSLIRDNIPWEGRAHKWNVTCCSLHHLLIGGATNPLRLDLQTNQEQTFQVQFQQSKFISLYHGSSVKLFKC